MATVEGVLKTHSRSRDKTKPILKFNWKIAQRSEQCKMIFGSNGVSYENTAFFLIDRTSKIVSLNCNSLSWGELPDTR